MSEQDWDPITFIKKFKQIDLKKKKVQNSNPSIYKKSNLKKLDGDNPLPPKKISKQLSMEIQKARLVSKLSQKQLAQRISVKQEIITTYENGKAIFNKQIFLKIENALNTKFTYRY